MDEVRLILKDNLKKAKFELNEQEEEVIFLLLKHKYGLYAAEIARVMKFNGSKVRALLYGLRSKGLLESKEIESIISQSVALGQKLIVPDGYRVMSNKNLEIPCKKGCVTRISDANVVVDEEGFRIPFQRISGTHRAVMYKIKTELFEILSQT